jgi:hypothetical protein
LFIVRLPEEGANQKINSGAFWVSVYAGMHKHAVELILDCGTLNIQAGSLYEESVVDKFKSNLLLMIFWLNIINYNS